MVAGDCRGVGWLPGTLGGLVAGEGLFALRHSQGLGCRMPESRMPEKRTMLTFESQLWELGAVRGGRLGAASRRQEP